MGEGEHWRDLSVK
jgi:hypothetical protein